MSEIMACPACGGTIRVAAQICKHCNRWLSELEGQTRWEGDLLVLHARTNLAPVSCLMCASTDRVAAVVKTFRKAESFTDVSPSAHRIPLPLCAPCASGWKLAYGVFAVFAVVGFFALPIIGGLIADGAGVGLGFLLYLVLGPTLVYGWVNRKRVLPMRAARGEVALKFPDPHATRQAIAAIQSASAPDPSSAPAGQGLGLT